MNVPASVASIGLRGTQRAMSSGLTKLSIKPEATVPSSRNGIASMKMPRKRVRKMLEDRAEIAARAEQRQQQDDRQRPARSPAGSGFAAGVCLVSR